jgi:hypothetical protein
MRKRHDSLLVRMPHFVSTDILGRSPKIEKSNNQFRTSKKPMYYGWLRGTGDRPPNLVTVRIGGRDEKSTNPVDASKKPKYC